MHPLKTLLPAALLAGACTSPSADEFASTERRSARQCFWASGVTSFSDAGPNRALVNVGRQDTWQLELSPGCPNVDYAMRLGIVSRGSERICSGVDAELLVPTASERGFQRCLVRNVRKLSPQEAAAAGRETTGR